MSGRRPSSWAAQAPWRLALLLSTLTVISLGPVGGAHASALPAGAPRGAAPPVGGILRGTLPPRSRAQTVPTAPVDVVAVAHDEAVNVTWEAPASDGGEPITSYVITWSPPGNTGNSTSVGNIGHAWVSGLTNGVAYAFHVAARNVVGTGPASSPAATAIPGLPPLAPQNVSVRWGNGSAVINWTAPPPRPGYPDQLYQVNLTNATWALQRSTTSVNVSVGGLQDGDRYRVAVEAVNALGGGPNSTAVFFTPYGPPGPVPDLVGTPGPSSTEILLTWSLPGWLGGSPLENYTIRWTGTDGTSGVGHASSNATQWAFWGAMRGVTYDFLVQAGGRGGVGPIVEIDVVDEAPSSATSGPAPLSATVVLLVFIGLFGGVAVVLVVSGRRARQRRLRRQRADWRRSAVRGMYGTSQDLRAPDPGGLDLRHPPER